MALHCRENGDNTSIGDWRSLFVFDPPIMKGSVRANKETLLWGWCFGKGIVDVGSKNKHNFRGRYDVEQAGTCLIDLGLKRG